jgi:hypothetical protein
MSETAFDAYQSVSDWQNAGSRRADARCEPGCLGSSAGELFVTFDAVVSGWSFLVFFRNRRQYLKSIGPPRLQPGQGP